MSVSPSMPFSRSIVRTASMISRDMFLLPFCDQVAPHDRLVRDDQRFLVRADGDRALVRVHDLAAQAPLRLGAERDAATDDVAEVLRRAQRPLDSRRRDGDLPVAA